MNITIKGLPLTKKISLAEVVDKQLLAKIKITIIVIRNEYPVYSEQTRMKIIDIDIDKTKAIFYALEKDAEGNYLNCTGKIKYIH